MSRIGIALALLCIAYAAPERGFFQIVREKRCCSDENGLRLNGTFLTPLPRDSVTSLGNGSTVSLLCYLTCFIKSFETNVVTRSCYDTCFSDNLSKLNDSSVVDVNKERHRGEGNDYEGMDMDSNASMNTNFEGNETQQSRCGSIFSSLNFWGANIVIFANMIYIIPYIIVVFVYIFVPGLRTRAYDRAVLWYNISQVAENCILIWIGASVLCHLTISPNVFNLLGMGIIFLTISSTLWLFVICIDMTLAITRLRQAGARSARGKTSTRDAERKKFMIYAAVSWGIALIPTLVALIVEFSPLLPKSSPIRPRFDKFQDGANVSVIIYVAALPALTCLANTVLFSYTTYRLIVIRRETAFATKSNAGSPNNDGNRLAKIREKYFLFLKLYLLMDAPWLTSGLAAALPNLWILKFIRMIQPMLMLFAILPPKTLRRLYDCCTGKSNRVAATPPP